MLHFCLLLGYNLEFFFRHSFIAVGGSVGAYLKVVQTVSCGGVEDMDLRQDGEQMQLWLDATGTL